MQETATLDASQGKKAKPPALVLSVIIVVVFSYGLQMYCTVPAFAGIGDEFNLGLSEISLLVSGFFLGYAISHIPAGIVASAWGFKTVAVGGMGILTASTVLFAVSNSFTLLLVSRVIGGVGMAAVVGCVIPLATLWSHPDRVRLIVGGVVNGIGFTSGSAAALYIWTKIDTAWGWRAGILSAGGVGLVATVLAFAFLATPPNVDKDDVESFSWKSAVVCLRSRSMWAIGIGSVSAYGIAVTVGQLAPGYVVSDLGFTDSKASVLVTLMVIVGVPGSLLGGYLADRSKRFLPTLWVPAALLAVFLVAFPFASASTIWVVLIGIGIFGAMYFSPCVVAPGEYVGEISPRDFGTALGLILTLGNAGAIIFPFLYGSLAESTSFITAWITLAALGGLSCLSFVLASEPRKQRTSETATSRRVVEASSESV